MNTYKTTKAKTNEFVRVWKNCKAIAPKSVTEKYAKAVLEWQVSLTDTLSIWINKGTDMTDGELILANANLGALVECWLKLFLCAYYEEYKPTPIIVKGKEIEPENASFESLKLFFHDKVFTTEENVEWFDWIEEIQHKRNAIHSFKYREIGTSIDFSTNLNKYFDFVEFICDRLPPIEDYCQ